MRLVQGAPGAAGIVVARAIVRDLYARRRGGALFSRLMIVFGLAPILAPIIGGQLLHITDWRGIFVVLAADRRRALVSLLAAARETLPPAERQQRRPAADAARARRARARPPLQRPDADLRALVRRGLRLHRRLAVRAREHLRPLAAAVRRRVRGERGGARDGEPGRRAAARALGLASGSRSRRPAMVGVLSGVGLLAAVLAHAGLWAVLPCFFVLIGSYGIVSPNLTALAMAPHPRVAGQRLGADGARPVQPRRRGRAARRPRRHALRDRRRRRVIASRSWRRWR